MPWKVTYIQVHRGHTPDSLILLTRCGDQWAIALSEDYGVSWKLRPFVLFDVGTYGYLITSRLANGSIRVCAAGHPAHTSLTAVYYLEISASGDVRSANGSVLANIYTGAGLPIAAPGTLPAIYTFPPNTNVRLFDVSTAPDPEVLLAEWVGAEEASYVYLKRDDLGWTRATLTPTGRPFGYEFETRYLGGATFPSPTNGGVLYLSRESAGRWRVERWQSEEGQWDSELISESEQILARPSTPLSASPQLPLLWLRLTTYDDYETFAGSINGLLPEDARGAGSTPVTGVGWDGVATRRVQRGLDLARGRSYDRVPVPDSGDRPLVGRLERNGKDSVGVRRTAGAFELHRTRGLSPVRTKRGDTPVIGVGMATGSTASALPKRTTT
jgi:hypothetical protein